MTNDAVRQNWLQLASIQIGGAISLPLLFVGYEIAKFCHPLTAFISILMGNLLLFGISLISGWISISRRRVTVQYATIYFGKLGRVFFGLVFALTMLVWFAVQSQSVGRSVYYLVDRFQSTRLQDSSFWQFLFSFLVAAAVIAGSFFGVKMLTRIALFCIPIMAISVGYFIIQAGTFSSTVPLFTVWSGQAVSLVLAVSIAGVIDLPTFYRHAHKFSETCVASFLTYLITVPIIEYLGACLYYSFSVSSIQDALVAISASSWKYWTLLFIILTGWTTNNLNLYSASYGLKVFNKKFSFSQAVGVAGLIGVLLIAVPMLDQFSSLINLMGVFVISMGSIILTAFVFEEFGVQPNFKLSWIAWIAGSGMGLLEITLGQFGTGAIILDAGLTAALIVLTGNLPAVLKRAASQPKTSHPF